MRLEFDVRMSRLVKNSFWMVSGALVAVLVLFVAQPKAAGDLRRVEVPGGGRGADIQVVSGRLHMVFARGQDIYYASSADEGATLSAPVRVNTRGAFIDRERGPKLAIGKDDSIHVVWMDSPPHRILYARSLDGGRRFSEPLALVTDERGEDGPSIAADDKSSVYVVWLGMGDRYDTSATATMQLTVSRDNGATFSTPQPVRSNYPGGACACCGLRAFLGANGELFIAFRGAHRNIRDIFLLRTTNVTSGFEAAPVSNDRWRLEACPTMGPFAYYQPKQILVSWMSDGQAYYAASKDGGKTFTPRVAPAQRASTVRRNPFAVANERGETLFGWIEERTVSWEKISPEGRVLESGQSPLTVNTRPTAFVDQKGGFVLVY